MFVVADSFSYACGMPLIAAVYRTWTNADMIVVPKAAMDGAVKDKHFNHFDADFRAEILLSDTQERPTMKRSDTGSGFVKVAARADV